MLFEAEWMKLTGDIAAGGMVESPPLSMFRSSIQRRGKRWRRHNCFACNRLRCRLPSFATRQGGSGRYMEVLDLR